MYGWRVRVRLSTIGLTCALGAALPAGPANAQGATPTELAATLESSFRGRIVIPRDVDWEMKRADGAPLTFLQLPAGDELVGERGALGSRPTLRATFDAQGYPLFQIQQGGVRVEGVHLMGPRRPKDRFKTLPAVKAISVVQDAPNQRNRPTVIADMEIDRWLVGVDVEGVKEVKEPSDYCDTPGCPLPLPSDAGLLRVERSYIHDNTGVGGGYGVVVGGGCYATVEGNVFQFNNHSIAASGNAYSGYVALFNYVLRGVYTFGEDRTLPHSLDVHGTGGSGGSHAGGRAGTYFQLKQNVILGEQDYGFAGRLTRAAFALRGRAVRGVELDDAVTFGISHLITENAGAAFHRQRLAIEIEFSVENIIAQNKRCPTAVNKIGANDERLRDPVWLGLFSVLDPDA